MSIIDRPRRTCASCSHWSSYNRKSDAGYIESICEQPDDDRDRKLKRASDYCSKWVKRVVLPAYSGSLVVEF